MRTTPKMLIDCSGHALVDFLVQFCSVSSDTEFPHLQLIGLVLGLGTIGNMYDMYRRIQVKITF